MAQTLIRDAILDVLKEDYPSGLDNSWLFKTHPFIGRMTRKKNLQSRLIHLPIQYSKQNGVSHDATTANDASSATNYEAFQVTPPIINYARANLSGQVVRMAMESREGALQFVNTFRNELKGGLQSFGDRQAKEALGDGGGSLARVGSFDGTADTITLDNKELVHFFEIGMRLVFSADDGTDASHALRDSGDYVTITAIDDELGVLTCKPGGGHDVSDISGLANNDYIFAAGDFKAAARGWRAWNPFTAPGTSDSFYGVNRSVRKILSGLRYDGSNDSMDTVFIKCRARARRFGLQDKPIHINPVDLSRLELAKEGQKWISSDSEYGIGFEGFSYGGQNFVVDNDMVPGTAYQGDIKEFVYQTNGDQPKLDDYDGLELVRNGTNYRVDFVCDYLFWTDKPWMHMNIKLPTKGTIG